VRRITSDNQLALACTSCRFAHYVTIGSVVSGPSASEEAAASTDAAPSSEAQAHLAGCLEAHAAALSLREMDVFEDFAVLRCAECRRHYAVTVTAFETQPK
jgi:hypothetical protein